MEGNKSLRKKKSIFRALRKYHHYSKGLWEKTNLVKMFWVQGVLGRREFVWVSELRVFHVCIPRGRSWSPLIRLQPRPEIVWLVIKCLLKTLIFLLCLALVEPPWLGCTLKDFFVISVQLFWTTFWHIFLKIGPLENNSKAVLKIYAER